MKIYCSGQDGGFGVFNESELRIAVLQILLEQRRKRPKTGGASVQMLADVLGIDNASEALAACIQFLQDSECLEKGERLFMITAIGVDRLQEWMEALKVFDFSYLVGIQEILKILITTEATPKLVVESLRHRTIESIEFDLWYLSEHGHVESGEGEPLHFVLTESGWKFAKNLMKTDSPEPPTSA